MLKQSEKWNCKKREYLTPETDMVTQTHSTQEYRVSLTLWEKSVAHMAGALDIFVILPPKSWFLASGMEMNRNGELSVEDVCCNAVYNIGIWK